MLSEAKLALRVTVDAYDLEIASLLEAGAHDLEIAGVRLPGTVEFIVSNGTLTDNSTLEDALCKRAILTYVRAHFGNPPDADRVAASYDLQKVQLMHAAEYTDYEGGGCGC